MNIQDKINQLESLKRKGITEVFAPIYTPDAIKDICYDLGHTGDALSGEELTWFIRHLDDVEMDELLDKIRSLHDKFIRKVRDLPALGDLVRHHHGTVGIVIRLSEVIPIAEAVIITSDGTPLTCNVCNLRIIRRRTSIISGD